MDTSRPELGAVLMTDPRALAEALADILQVSRESETHRNARFVLELLIGNFSQSGRIEDPAQVAARFALAELSLTGVNGYRIVPSVEGV